MSEWTSLASMGDLEEGQMLAVEHGDGFIALARVNDTVYAFDDECTHQACELSDGELDGDQVICPCHESYFNIVTGNVHGGPAEDPIRTYPARVENGEIQVLV